MSNCFARALLLFPALLMAPKLYAGPVPDSKFVVHEWGTFTSLQGSNGVNVSGMVHEEEALPGFVHNITFRDFNFARSGCGSFKGFPICDEPAAPPRPTPIRPAELRVTQKMETPVLYFHSRQARDVSLQIGFPAGVISQYYPMPQAVGPSLKPSQARGGYVNYNFKVLAAGEKVDIPAVAANSVYAPSREVEANYIQTSSNETEKLIFYRGLGDFSTDVLVSSTRDGRLTIQNTSKSFTIPASILLDSRHGGTMGSFFRLQSIAPGESVEVELSKLFHSEKCLGSQFIGLVAGELTRMLTAQGLFEDEALAMVNTWKKSYFKTDGLRLLHVLPQPATEAILPLAMQPAPDALVRVLVGRIEIMTANEERSLIQQIAEQGSHFDLAPLQHLAEPKLRRVRELVPVGFATDIDELIQKAKLTPL